MTWCSRCASAPEGFEGLGAAGAWWRLRPTKPRRIGSGGARLHGVILPREGGEELLQRAIDRRELGVEVAAQTVHDRDDRKRDTGRDQTVFNRGRSRLIGQELQKAALQTCLLWGL